MSRTGQVWKQTQSEDDDPKGECTLVWLVLSSQHVWDKVVHRVFVLEASGSNWRSHLITGAEVDMDEPRIGWWEDLAKFRGCFERLS